MKTHYLLPCNFKKIGWMLLVLGIIPGIIFLINASGPEFLKIQVLAIAEASVFGSTKLFSVIENNIFDEIIGLLIIVGALFVAFSKEKSEDEFISKIRLESLVWATYVNYAILILAILFIYDMTFLWVLIFNMFIILVFFLIRFNWVLIKSKKQIRDEE